MDFDFCRCRYTAISLQVFESAIAMHQYFDTSAVDQGYHEFCRKRAIYVFHDASNVGQPGNQTMVPTSYDIQFRLRMANDPSRSWSNDDGHLWITCSLFGTASGPPMLKPKTVGQCYDFNYKAGCLKPFCKYAHTCMVCKAVHPVVNCTRSCPQSVAPESRDVTLPNVRPQFGKRFSPSHINRQLLDQYPNREEAEYLVNGLENGFLLGFSGPREPFECKNLKSVNGHGSIVRQKLLTEVAAGIISGPFVNKPISNLRVSHIGLVPKRTDGFRLITHMSYPYLESVREPGLFCSGQKFG
ncbi:hypothetical protein MAR_013771 [Mya arenaria]|uniref:Uncharacterized protein n=1 Tax=Mya arenaria TaxID=6604 RepID=A0ABY7G2C8_MYAAR|nr:hypothetical protein MAR_013771 [Mya arenaria]